MNGYEREWDIRGKRRSTRMEVKDLGKAYGELW
jgi:hypothetical protein